jgi:hypothetical protein
LGANPRFKNARRLETRWVSLRDWARIFLARFWIDVRFAS